MLLVTGGTGFLGQHLVSSLLRKRKKIRILARDRTEARKLFPKVQIAQGDILHPETLKPALRGVKTVIHLAGLVSYSKPRAELMKINLEGTQNLLSASTKVKKFIFSGSVGAMGPTAPNSIAKETDPCHPATPYGHSKLLAENLIQASGIPYAILRLAPVYGKGSPSWIKNLKMLEKGFPIPNIQTLTHVLHVNNAVQAFELSVRKGSGIYLVADKKPILFTDFASRLVTQLGQKPKLSNPWIVNFLSTVSGKALYLKVLTMNRHYNISKARKELGYKPSANFQKELKSMVKWYKGLKPSS